ncbi:capsule polysaccharide biosynthesis protein [Fusarium oxysporum]|nr:capsule polysaccharide biosynthesis protein [Fusarium oxysporum]
MMGRNWLVITALGIFAKSLPFVWHLRFFWALLRWKLSCCLIGSTRLTSRHVFLPSIVDAQSTLSECDFNLHKSYSTYFTDLDVARSHLSGILFAPIFVGNTPLERCNLVVGAVSCVFRKEIKPNQPYELSTKVVSWDEKWIYMVTHFVSLGTARPQGYMSEAFQRRITVPPGDVLKACGFHPERAQEPDTPVSSESAPSHPSSPCAPAETGGQSPALSAKDTELTYDEMESRREDALPLVQFQSGWDAVHSLFQIEPYVLARHKDFL